LQQMIQLLVKNWMIVTNDTQLQVKNWMIATNDTQGQKKKKCVFTVTRPTLIFASDPMHFYTEFG
jgi:hypothetical protein